jgi:DNA-binding MurR/RpiR family transcriptional regulator
MALGTVAEVAERARVQPSAIVRFARAMGYGGFTEMQQVFRSRLVASAAPSYGRISGLRSDGRFNDGENPLAVLARFASESMVSLESLQDSVREKDLARAIAFLGAAQTIYVLGLGGSYPVAAHLTYVLRKLGRRVTILDGLGSAIGDQAAAATPKDALIAISFKTYNPDTVRLFPTLMARGLPTVSITDSLLSPIVEGADVVFEIPDMPEAALRTMVGPMCLAQSLAVSCRWLSIESRDRHREETAMSDRMLEGQVALVTGAGRGLGRAFAERLAALGCQIAVHGMREHGPSEYDGSQTLSDVARSITGAHRVRTVKILADLTQVAEVERTAATAAAELGPIDILVHNAGGDIAPPEGQIPRWVPSRQRISAPSQTET